MEKIFKLLNTTERKLAKPKSVRIAYFLFWPTPNLEDKFRKTFDKQFGVPVTWTPYSNGNAMTDAMMAGDIDISYSQGSVPFINETRSGIRLKLVDIAMEYGMGGTTCIVSKDINKKNAKEKLEGQTVAVPLGTMAEYVFDQTIKKFGINRNKLKIKNMLPEQGARAFVNGDVKLVALFGGNSIKTALTVGKRLLTIQEATAAGIVGIDITSVPEKFTKEYPEIVKNFIKINMRLILDLKKETLISK